MDELKEIYGIELTNTDKWVLVVDILTEEYLKTVKILGKSTNDQQRINALSRQKAIAFAIGLMK